MPFESVVKKANGFGITRQTITETHLWKGTAKPDFISSMNLHITTGRGMLLWVREAHDSIIGFDDGAILDIVGRRVVYQLRE